MIQIIKEGKGIFFILYLLKFSARLVKYPHEIYYSFFKKFLILNFIKEKKEEKIEKEETYIEQEIEYVNNNELLEKLCLTTNKKLCLLGFFDGKENESSKNSFDNSMKIYKDFQKKHYNKPYNFGWVNATCQENFSSKFNVNLGSLPNLIAYIPSRDVYAMLVGTFEMENLDIFINKVIKGQANFSRMEKKFVRLDDIKCEEIKEFEENLEDDEILKEILEEQRIKKEQAEKERLAEEEPKKKKKKGNKKKKKKDL